MTKPITEMMIDKWEKIFKPVLDEDGQYNYELWHSDQQFKEAPADCIWTVHDGDLGGIYLMSGVRHVNRFGFVVTNNPFPEHADIIVYDLASYELEIQNLEDERLSLAEHIEQLNLQIDKIKLL